LDELGRRRITHLLVEGGGSIHGSFIDQSLADRVVVYIAPAIIGGVRATPAVAGRGADKIAAALRFSDYRLKRLGEDIVIEADL
jgi:diaminohydroxyphosphoribosylaminopyrimidine deaminase/5-amino-6-(5-phosphoribosylamino)uracil reductase